MLQYEYGDRTEQKTFPMLKSKLAEVLPFTASSIGEFICDERYYTRREGLESCLLLYTLEGYGIIHYENNEMELRPGEIIVLDCRKYHYYATGGDKWHFLWFHFAGKCAFDYVDILNGNGGFKLSDGSRIAFQELHRKMIFFGAHPDRQGELENSAVIQRLLTDLIELKKREDFSKKYAGYRNELEKSISYMQENIKDDMNIEVLADICHLSKYHYIKVFKAYTGHTPYDYFLNLRLQNSQQLLLETEKSIGEISVMSGFDESKNYIACFKKKVGMTPLQYRKLHRI